MITSDRTALANNPMFSNTHHAYSDWSREMLNNANVTFSREGDAHFAIKGSEVIGYWIGQGYSRKPLTSYPIDSTIDSSVKQLRETTWQQS